MRTLKEYVSNPARTLNGLCYHLITSTASFLPDRLYLKLLFRNRMRCALNLDNPRTFCEKIQYLKIKSKDHPEYSKMVDKIEAKKYVASIIGDKYVIPTLGIWNDVEDIDWDALPNEFVIKSTSDSGGVVICNDKQQLDREKTKKKLKNLGKREYYMVNREYPYKDVPHRYIAEKLIIDKNQAASTDLADYKFFCFNGVPTYCQVIRDRRSKETIDFYDMEWNHMPFVGLSFDIKNGDTKVPRPQKLDEMISISEKLARNIPFSRIDLYYANDQVYFGEITFFPASGFEPIIPAEWNDKLGDLIQL